MSYFLRDSIIKRKMSFFFNKSDSQENLQYDDTAFLHFAISTTAITAVLFVLLIFRDISARKKKNIGQVRKLQHFKKKLAKTEKDE